MKIGELIETRGHADFAEFWLRHRGLYWAADLLANLETPDHLKE